MIVGVGRGLRWQLGEGEGKMAIWPGGVIPPLCMYAFHLS